MFWALPPWIFLQPKYILTHRRDGKSVSLLCGAGGHLQANQLPAESIGGGRVGAPLQRLCEREMPQCWRCTCAATAFLWHQVNLCADRMNTDSLPQVRKPLIYHAAMANLLANSGVWTLSRELHALVVPSVHAPMCCDCSCSHGLAAQVRCIAAVLLLVGRGLEAPSLVACLLDVEQLPGKPQYCLAPEVCGPCSTSSVGPLHGTAMHPLNGMSTRPDAAASSVLHQKL